jgi:hypothetical protein
MSGFNLEDDDVVSLVNGQAFRVGPLIRGLIQRSLGDDYVKAWSSFGIDCEFLRAGRNWQRGRIRLKLEFIPDKPQSVLDDLRSDLKI